MNKEEAIKIVRSHYPANKQMLNEALEFLIPELKVSEDEMIRKSLIELFKDMEWDDSILHDYNIDKDKTIAWLEKQVTPQVRTGIEWVNTIDDACDKRYSEEYAEGEYCHEQSFKWGFQEGVDWLEKQVEPKSNEREKFTSIPFGAYDSELIDETITIPDGCVATIEDNKIHIKREGNSATEAIKEEKIDNANKVEPKFHEGDWVVRKNGNNFYDNRKFAKIIEIDGLICRFDNGRWLYDYEIRPWSLTDAKNGDILASSNSKAFIYNGNFDPFNVGAYCGLGINNDFVIADNQYGWCHNYNIKPATKEERQTLFNKMNLLGYVWNPETKELNRLDK